MNTGVVVVVALAVVVAALVVANVVMKKKGYDIPGQTAARCSKGHLFRTRWIEGASLTAVRLGPTRRYQRCPVGHHWALVRPVKAEDLTAEERQVLDASA